MLRFLLLLTSIFALNDLFFLYVKSYVGWLAVDYASRILAILIVSYLIKTKRCSFGDFGFTKIGIKPFIFWAVILSAVGIFIDQAGWKFFENILPKTQAFAFPKITNHIVKIFDQTVGIALVSLTEEPIFRGFYFSVLKRYTGNPFTIVAVSSIAFGLIHWSSGLHAVITTALWAILPMVSVLRTRSVLPAVVAHYLTDFVYFFQ